MGKLLRAVMALFVSIVTILLSIKYTFMWLEYNGLGGAWSFLLSSVIVICAVFVFDLMVINSKKLGKILFFFVWFILASYSMISTMAGQYDQMRIKTAMENPPDNGKIDFYNNKIAEYNNNIIELKTELIAINGQLNQYDTNWRRQYYTDDIEKLNIRIVTVRDLILKNEEKKEIAEQKLIDIKNGDKINNQSVYDYFSRIIKINAIVIQFVLSIFPAIIIDVIAPISTAFFLSEIDIVVKSIKKLSKKKNIKPVIIKNYSNGQSLTIPRIRDNTAPIDKSKIF